MGSLWIFSGIVHYIIFAMGKKEAEAGGHSVTASPPHFNV